MNETKWNEESQEMWEEPKMADESEADETDGPMSEEEFREQYQKLPLWQHVILVILFLFGLTAAIMVIDFAVEFLVELFKHIF